MAADDDDVTGEFAGVPTRTDPDTPTEHRFLLSLRDHPDDDGMRMVYADWLEEHGQTLKAELVRGDAPAHRHRILDPEWRAIIGRTPIEGCDDVSFRFKCPKQWQALATTDDATVRHCGTCNKPVYFCTDLGEIRLRAYNRECVAFCPTLDRGKALEQYDDELMTMTMMGEVSAD
jgi:uncharacterized protein (TIGR02996 family)